MILAKPSSRNLPFSGPIRLFALIYLTSLLQKPRSGAQTPQQACTRMHWPFSPVRPKEFHAVGEHDMSTVFEFLMEASELLCVNEQWHSKLSLNSLALQDCQIKYPSAVQPPYHSEVLPAIPRLIYSHGAWVEFKHEGLRGPATTPPLEPKQAQAQAPAQNTHPKLRTESECTQQNPCIDVGFDDFFPL